MAKFEDLAFKPGQLGGAHAIVVFPNGYGASIVCNPFSYGGPKGLYEIAVLDGQSITYDTPITSDVLGYLTEEDVEKTLADIEALPNKKK